MIERALAVGLGLLGICFSAAAQQTLNAPSALNLYPPEVFNTVDSATMIHDLPVFALLDGTRLPVSTDVGRMGVAPLSIFSTAFLTTAPTQQKNATRRVAVADAKDSLEELMNPPLRVYTSGEIGVLYGRGTGKFSGDLWQTYMIGEVGNDKFHITVGAAYEEWSGRGVRYRAFTPSW